MPFRINARQRSLCVDAGHCHPEREASTGPKLPSEEELRLPASLDAISAGAVRQCDCSTGLADA